MKTVHRHHAFGLTFASELPLPEMRRADEDNCDVEVRLGPAPCPSGLTLIENGVLAGPDAFWMDVPQIARILVERGTQITIDPASGIDAAAIRPFLLGSAMGALLQQRGLFLLHASAVAIGGRAVAFAGTSGAGKSTFALNMVARGHMLLADDIAALDTGDPTKPVLLPGLATLKATRAALQVAELWHENLRPVPDLREKFYLPADSRDDAMPLGAIILLEAGEPLSIVRLQGAEAAAMLTSQSFRGQLVMPMRRTITHFSQCMTLAACPGVHRLTRPWSLDAAEESCAAVQTLMTC